MDYNKYYPVVAKISGTLSFQATREDNNKENEYSIVFTGLALPISETIIRRDEFEATIEKKE